MAAGAHPPDTQQSLGSSPAPPPSCPQRPWAVLLFSALGAEPPCGSEGLGAPAAPAFRAGAPSPGSRPGSTCARPYWIHCPSHCLRAGATGKEQGRTEPGFSPSPTGVPEPNWPAGKAGRTPGIITTPKSPPPSPSWPRALPPRHTHPCSDTRKAAPAAGGGRSPHGPGASG